MKSCGKATLVALNLAILTAGPAIAQVHGIWSTQPDAPARVAEVAVAALRGKIYAVGGTRQVGSSPPEWALDETMAYDPTRKRWQFKAPLPQKLTHVGLTALAGKLYAIGGFTGGVHLGPQAAAYEYNPATDRWRRLADLPEARGSVAVVAIAGKVHVFGGRASTKLVRISPPDKPEVLAGFGTVENHDIYDPRTNRWTSGAPVPGPPRDHMGAVALNGRIHLFGGRIADVSDNLDRHDVYDPSTDRWSTAAPLPAPRSSGAFAVIRGLIIYAGGECKPGGRPSSPDAYDDVTAYDPKTDRWDKLPRLAHARHAFEAATIGATAYFVGGALTCGGGSSADLQTLTIR